MYDELVKRLREKAGAFDYDGRPDIACDYEQAADAIEELVTNYDAATDIMKRQTEYIEELSKRRWIPVTERLPKWSETVHEGEPCVDGELVLVFAPKGEADKVWNNMAVGSWLGDRWEVLDDAFTLNAITHWMPLPQPPEEGLA